MPHKFHFSAHSEFRIFIYLTIEWCTVGRVLWFQVVLLTGGRSKTYFTYDSSNAEWYGLNNWSFGTTELWNFENCKKTKKKFHSMNNANYYLLRWTVMDHFSMLLSGSFTQKKIKLLCPSHQFTYSITWSFFGSFQLTQKVYSFLMFLINFEV